MQLHKQFRLDWKCIHRNVLMFSSHEKIISRYNKLVTIYKVSIQVQGTITEEASEAMHVSLYEWICTLLYITYLIIC